ncbi:hypothetical protein Syun_006195 [Stephania yunnanensis]|uniref:Disease resistance protein RGA3 n=1 Tax=Stephania yunnanensis TaxID=152371 RepID=A0AAP0KZJ0_9MAGN
MMGEYAFGAGEMVNRLLSICFEEIGLVGGVKDEVKKLETVLRVIQAVLHDAERKQGEREVVRQWLHQLKQVAYDAEDVLDEVDYKKLKYSVDNMTPRWLNPKRGIARLKIAHKIKAINKRLADIYENMKLLQLVQLEPPNNDQSGNSSGFGDNRETASDVNESAVIGRDKDKEKIIKMLINDDDAAAAALSVIAIVGLGGIGKTTLAQLVYNDGAVKKHFELKAWVCVSTKFKVENLFSQILQLINENSTKTESSSKEVLQKELRSQLGGKKFLLVLDDDWNEDETKWEDFLLPFMTNAAMGSKIIVTTRDRKVASVKGAHHALYLEGLSGEDCWGLIENQAFKRGGPLKTSRLVEIGREISKKCHGVPLAAKVLGGLLCSIKEGEWWGVLKDEIMSLDQRDLIKNVLKLSYDNLSPALQACFSYCAIFPKDYLISTELLIQLWMAQGLLEAPRQQLLLKACNSQRKLTLEDAAGTICFDALYSKSFFQEAKMNKYGEVTHCKIHHHLHDLAQSIMDSECQVMGESSIMRRTDLSECRHVSMISLSTIEALDEVKKLRTIFGWESTCKAPRADALFKFKSLRVLDLSGFRGYDFSSTINSFKYLKHLRYLDLSYTSITSLPTWVTGLYHLQTLKLIECHNLTELPEDLMKLKQQLRHLFIDDYKRWKKMPQAIGELHQLQTLPFFVGHEGVGISVFKNLNELRGALDIHRLRLMKEESLAKRVIKPLREKSNLRELRLHWDDDRESSSSSAGGDGSNDFNVLEELQPQTNLQWLSVEDYCGVEFPAWMSAVQTFPT